MPFLSDFLDTVRNILFAFLGLFYRSFAKNALKFEKTGLLLAVNDELSLGEGAFSTVYTGADLSDPSKSYAIKKMFLQSPEFEKSYADEVSAFHRFKHPSIMRLLDTRTEIKDGVKIGYLLFPLMRRGSLRDELNRTVLKQGPIARFADDAPSLKGMLNDFLGIISAINILHTHTPAYVHQDIKPENILIADDGRPLLTDFGSVRLAEIAINNRTQALNVADQAASLCTVSYRAPELFDPQRNTTLDTRTDVWAIGCLIFAWRFGLSPFESEFNTDTGIIRCVESSHSRVLCKMPRKPNPTRDDTIVLDLAEWILVQNFAVRPLTSDIIERVLETIANLGSSTSSAAGSLPV